MIDRYITKCEKRIPLNGGKIGYDNLKKCVLTNKYETKLRLRQDYNKRVDVDDTEEFCIRLSPEEPEEEFNKGKKECSFNRETYEEIFKTCYYYNDLVDVKERKADVCKSIMPIEDVFKNFKFLLKSRVTWNLGEVTKGSKDIFIFY